LAYLLVLTAPGGSLHAQTAEEIENSLLWRQALGGAILASPSAQVQSVSVISEGGFVRTFGDTGKQLWEYAAGGRLAPFLVRSGTGMVFAGRTNGYFFALNRAGKLLWEKRLGEAQAWMPLVGWDGRVFVFLGRRILCFTATGNQLWEYKLEDAVIVQPVANGKGGFMALQKKNKLLLADPFGAITIVDLAPGATALLPGDFPAVLVMYADGEIETIRDGTSPKKQADDARKEEAARAKAAGKKGAPPAPPSPPLPPRTVKHVAGKAIAAVQYKRKAAIAYDSGDITLWSLDDEKELWTRAGMLGAARARLLFDERGIYLFTMSGGAGWTDDGRMLWNMKIQGATAPPVLSADGILYTGGSNWLLYAYKVEHRGRSNAGQASSSFPYNLPDEGNYGLGHLPSSAQLLFFDESDISSKLKHISRLVRQGDIGDSEPYAAQILLAVINGGDTISSADLIQKLEALNILSSIGTRETVPFLVKRLSAERDPNLRAGIVETLGRIGVDPNRAVTSHFEALLPHAVDTKDSRLLSTLAEAIGSLCRFSGPPVSETGIRLLVSIAALSASKTAADIAKKQLATLIEP
jgi:outer membrane protein assembly factor BamB